MLSSLRIASQVARRSVGAAINHTTTRFGSGLSFELSDEQQSMKVMIIVHFERYINLKNPIWRLKEFLSLGPLRGLDAWAIQQYEQTPAQRLISCWGSKNL